MYITLELQASGILTYLCKQFEHTDFRCVL